MSDEDSSDSSVDYDKPLMAKCDMNEQLIGLFSSIMLQNEFENALMLIDDPKLAPTSYIIQEIIFKIMINSDSKLAYNAQIYLDQSLKMMPTDVGHQYIFIEGLKGGPFQSAWDAFSHFVLSHFYHKGILNGFVSSQEYVKEPNCVYLVELYVRVFMKSPFKSAVFGSHLEEKFSSLTKWINAYYKHNVETDEVHESLHLLLDHIMEIEINTDPTVPKCAALYKAPLSPYIHIIMKNCKDALAHPENLQSFFINTESSHLIMRVCQATLDALLEKEYAAEGLTLASIVQHYFFIQIKPENPEPTSEISPKKSRRGKKGKPSKDPMSVGVKSGTKYKGDTEFHVCCRSDRFDDLLDSLYKNKSQDINAKNSLGNTPLHEACLVGSYYCCKFLIEDAGVRKVDFKAANNEGRTPLHCAVYKDEFDIVKMLLNRGGPGLVKSQDSSFKKPIDYSQSEKIKNLLEETELKLEPSVEESKSSNSTQQRVPATQNYPLYLRSLCALINNYCEIYDIPKDETDVKILSHSDEACYHYKASAEVNMCVDDFNTLKSLDENIKKLSECVKLVSTEVNIEKELRILNNIALLFR